MKRREFLQMPAAAALMAAPANAAPWFDRPMRWAQVAFVEDDPGQYDRAFWLDYFRRIHADAACISAGGCVAFYPTKIAGHYRSRFMKDGTDPFGDLVKGCRDLGMNVMARTDPHGVHDDVARAHPDWIHVNADGKPRKHWADPEYWVTCALGPCNFDFMTRVTEEIVSLYQVDAIFSNRWAGHGTCYCEHCRRNFREFSGGLDLPRTDDPHDPSRRKYIVWHEARLFELWRLWGARIKAINPNAAFIANSGGGALSDLDMKTIGELVPTLVADSPGAPRPHAAVGRRQERQGVSRHARPQTHLRHDQRRPRGALPLEGLRAEWRRDPPVDDGWRGPGTAPVVHQIQRQARGPALAAGGWTTFSTGTTATNATSATRTRSPASASCIRSRRRRSMAVRRRMRGWRTTRSASTRHWWSRACRSTWCMTACSTRPTSVASGRSLLPNIAALSDAQCAQIRAFVERGGSLVATYETSLYNEWGDRRTDFGLASLFGASYAGRLEGPIQNSYLKIEGRHPLNAGLEDAGRIVNGVHRVHVRPNGESIAPPITVIPSYPDLPMESVWVRPFASHDAGVFAREVGKGRVVYFPWDIDRTFWEVMSIDHLRLLANAVAWATNEAPVVTVKGKGIFDLAVWDAEAVDDGASGEPQQPDDDEGPDP